MVLQTMGQDFEILPAYQVLFRSSKHGVGGGLLIHEGWFDSNDRSHFSCLDSSVGRAVC